MGSLLKSSNNAKKQTPSTVANNDDDFTDWALHSGVWLEPEENPIIQQALATVKSMTELVLPAEWWRVPNPPIPFEKFQAAPFRKAVVDAAREANLLQESDNDDSDNDDSRAIRGSFNILLTLWRDVETSKRKQENSRKITEATYRRNLDALVADVFEFPYKDAHDDKKCEFNEFEVCLEEHLFLQENPASTTEIHPDTIVTSPPIFAYEIYQALKRKRPPSSAAPRTTSDAYLLFSLYSNVHLQKSVTLDTHDLRIIVMGLEHKNPTKQERQARRRVFMTLSTAQRQRRALCLQSRTLFGITLDGRGVEVYVSFWNEEEIGVSQEPVYKFPLDHPLHIVQLFLFLRRLAKRLSEELEDDRKHIQTHPTEIADSLWSKSTVWRTPWCSSPMGPPALTMASPSVGSSSHPPPGPGLSHDWKEQAPDRSPDDSPPSPSSSKKRPAPNRSPENPPPGKRTHRGDVPNRTGLTTENMSRFNERQGSGQYDIERWTAYTTTSKDSDDPCWYASREVLENGAACL